MVDNAIKPAIRTALRFHEIGNDTPYRISFAGKGKSGGSFGFMQGDLAAVQPDVTSTFRDAMTRAGMSAQKINELLALLSKHQIKNPLSAADTAAVNQALQAAHDLVDAMDNQILQSVYRDLDRCDARAAAHQRSIEPKGVVYMALWINMSGPPTKLLTWLDGDDPHLARPVPPAGTTVSGDDMEDYLAATNYYVENPQNLAHLHACAAKGMEALGGAVADAAVPIVAMAAAVNLAAPMAAPPTPADMVRIAAKSADGGDYIVSIQKTGGDTGAIEFGKVNASPSRFDVSGIKARADGTRLTCSATLGTAVTCALRAGRPPTSDGIEITIGGWFGGTTVYTVSHPDFGRLQTFIAQAGFPVIARSAREDVVARAIDVVPGIADPQQALAPARALAADIYDDAVKAIELWRLQKSSSDYDAKVNPLVRNAAARVRQSPNVGEIARWLDIQASARGIADSEITETTLALRAAKSLEFQTALQQLPEAAKLRVNLELGDRSDQENAGLVSLGSSADLATGAVATDLSGVFIAQGKFISARNFPVMKGALTLKDRNGAIVGVYDVNTGGGAPDFRSTNGPIPPGIYRLSTYRPRSTIGMVLHGVGYSFDLDPISGTKVFGRSLFRLHPDGGSPQTNGCLGVRSDTAAPLLQCRDQLRALLTGGTVQISVSYGTWMT
ncbi:MAG: hypothetical protein EON84_08165 [Bradyrhizobiaceae bacterium]|nr:MAG: hypothetical protein EON84_08165 [Bradyrhizobiaceae bacterium]